MENNESVEQVWVGLFDTNFSKFPTMVLQHRLDTKNFRGHFCLLSTEKRNSLQQLVHKVANKRL